MENIDLAVIPKEVNTLRTEFAQLLPKLPRNWRKTAGKINPYFNTVDGFKTIQTVVSGRGRFETTRALLLVAKQIHDNTQNCEEL